MTETMELQPGERLLVTPDRAAAMLSISRRTLHDWTRRGIVRVIRIGRVVRYDPVDLRASLEARKDGANGVGGV